MWSIIYVVSEWIWCGLWSDWVSVDGGQSAMKWPLPEVFRLVLPNGFIHKEYNIHAFSNMTRHSPFWLVYTKTCGLLTWSNYLEFRPTKTKQNKKSTDHMYIIYCCRGLIESSVAILHGRSGGENSTEFVNYSLGALIEQTPRKTSTRRRVFCIGITIFVLERVLESFVATRHDLSEFRRPPRCTFSWFDVS